jgi:hypothetical protein
MSRLERRCRLLLRSYPAAYRRERGEEMVGTLLEATPAGRTSPLPRDSRALIMGGLKARAAQNRHLSTAANLRLAALLGVAIYLSFDASLYLDGGWSALTAGLLMAVAALLPWLGRRKVVIAAAVAAGAVAAYVGFSSASPAAPAFGALLWPLTAVLLPLAALAVLTGGAERPPRLWLGLPGLAVAAYVVAQLSKAIGWDGVFVFLVIKQDYLMLFMAVVALAWIGIDARPAVGLAIYLALLGLSQLDVILQPGQPAWMPLAQVKADSVWLVYAIALAMPALWRLRRQAVL